MRRLAVPALAAAALFVNTLVLARDGGQFMGSPLRVWFNNLASGRGLCCSFADGVSIQDVDWDMQGECDARVPVAQCAMHYRVRLGGRWVVVPDAAVVTEPNRFGPAVVWPYQDALGVTQIRCFMPGAGT